MRIEVMEKECSESIEIDAGTTVEQVLDKLSINPETVLAKRNCEFVADFSSEKLKENDTLELIKEI